MTGKLPVNLVWLKKDLRIRDHRPLMEAALQKLPVLIFYLFEPSIVADPHHSMRHWAFVCESLADMKKKLSDAGHSLWIFQDEATAFLKKVDGLYDIQQIYSHEETGLGITYKRDLAVADWCRETGVQWIEYPSNGVYRGLMNRKGWRNRWSNRMSASLHDPDLSRLTTLHELDSPLQKLIIPLQMIATPRPELEILIRSNAIEDRKDDTGVQGNGTLGGDKADTIMGHQTGSVLHTTQSDLQPTQSDLQPTQSDLHTTQSDLHTIQKGGETRAWQVLDEFLTARSANYAASISAPGPARTGCSRMSPYITWGNISIKQILHQTEKKRGEIAGRGGIRSFKSRLGWHCHFIQKLESEPRLEFENLNRGYDDLRLEKNADNLRAWEQGRTGFPMVDASMRSLNATGYLNFRMRAMLVSFLTHHLWLDWRDGSPHLARQFLDFEPGIHFSQLQMQAGTMGVNTIRIYNPVKQGKDHDPKGDFVREWVPELRGVPPTLVHEPWLMSDLEQMMAKCRIGVDYPAPVVRDLKESYRRASDQLWAKKKDARVQQENRRIMERHVKKRSGTLSTGVVNGASGGSSLNKEGADQNPGKGATG